MGAHSKGVSFRARTAVALVVSGLAAFGVVGTATAGDGIIDGTPCSVTARACVDIASKQAWLIDDGEIVRGPVPVSTGGEGRETPRGSFTVDWKNKDHKSAEFNGAPMPFAVFFAPGGIAFHEGNLHTPSAGCVRMAYEDAEAWFEFLQPGDPVEVH
ncbi:L,D-transpeptidase [Pseudonocardia abyssalis]|uniref:L,D-transpeptidase n=1 Tax=Pseudonocardia abyssalis TaxID=2792008 RepID=A0ABS6UXJ4_9PSEU|nr:L,D-transpeptidase [Pseudonocardia abyssalis]MBW0117086.1 L,D-transpeptidase [Pseudonocardia abyssalis]MBW0136588.1 L,D-transpeptidase [Pseudonocardia abyssalis]